MAHIPVMGDYNCVVQYVENKGGRLPSVNAMMEFQEAMDSYDLEEAQITEGKFTWYNNRRWKEFYRCWIECL